MSNQTTPVQKPKSKRKALWIVLGIIGGIFVLFVGIAIISSFLGQTSELPSYEAEEMAEAPAISSERMMAPSAEKFEEVELEEVPETAAREAELAEQKVIKTANLTLTVEKAGDTVSELNSLAVSKGGFILSSSVTTNPDGTQSASITLKVPVDKFEETVEDAKKLAKVIEKESLSGQDVTEKYTDLLSQLKNYQAEEEQYLEILKKATTIEDILKVTEKLSLVRGRIERTQGLIKYLESQTDMSTITITLKEEARIEIPTKEWRPLATLKRAFRSWIQFLQGLTNVLIWLVIFLGPPVILVWIIVKIVKRRKRKAPQG